MKTFLTVDRAAYKQLVCDASLADAEVYTKQCELIFLALVGFVAIAQGRWAKTAYLPGDEDFMLAANRLQRLCPDVGFEQLRAAVPVEDGPSCALDQGKSDQVCAALIHLLNGRPVQIESLPHALLDGSSAEIPSTQAAAPAAEDSMETKRSQRMLTQEDIANPSDSEGEPQAKKLRDLPLTAADLQTHRDAMKKLLSWLIRQKNDTLRLFRVNEKAKEFLPTTDKPYEVAAKAAKLLSSGGLAQKSQAKASSLDLVKIPEASAGFVCAQLADVLGIGQAGDRQRQRLEEQLLRRPDPVQAFEMSKFEACMALCHEGFSV